MTTRLSAMAWVLGIALAAVVVSGGIRTSSAGFSATTSNGTNFWQAADLSLDVDGGAGSRVDLFLDGRNLFPGRDLENCVSVATSTGLDDLRLRLHGASIGTADDLGPYLVVEIERGTAAGGCDDFQPVAQLFDGPLQQLLAQHRSFESGLVLDGRPGQQIYLRFTGSILDTNQAQGLSSQYVVRVEARP